DGKQQNILLPEDADYEIFENGAFPVFTLRGKPNHVDYVFAIKDYSDKNTSIKVQDKLYKINNVDAGKIEDPKQLTASGTTTLV
ncbi:hypothetical protein G7L55_24260, partial [Shigella sonnei]|uniref:hypothetical protein n=1 Tax=Shigella sonnei TaxID=624 RepID=UPI001494F455